MFNLGQKKKKIELRPGLLSLRRKMKSFTKFFDSFPGQKGHSDPSKSEAGASTIVSELKHAIHTFFDLNTDENAGLAS